MGEALQEEVTVVVVGGSVAGLCCAVSLLHHHQGDAAAAAVTAHPCLQAPSPVALHVVVLEKARSLTAAGAGLGLDSAACAALVEWGLPLLSQSLPLSYEENRVVHGITKRGHVVARDEQYNYLAVHWSDVHRMLYKALPAGTVKWGHEVTFVEECADRKHVQAHFRAEGNPVIIGVMKGSLLIAADGSMSEIRKKLLPHEKRRYCDYCAWRGVLDASTKEMMELKSALQVQYPRLGHCLYFDIAENTHAVLYELTGNRLNWLWYVNQPEPNLKGSSATVQADDEAIERMHQEAKHVWPVELAALMQATPAPFINAIFDKDPVKQLVWGRTVLVGEAAHPMSPHASRSTNASILDAAVLGQCMAKWDWQVDEALAEFETLCMPLISRQVLFSRYLGQVKQGLSSIRLPKMPLDSDGSKWDILLHRSLHRFEEEANTIKR